MSEYRDDALDTLRLSDSTWIIVKATNANEVLRLIDSTQSTITVQHHDQFTLSDSFGDSTILNAYDHFTLSDSVSGQKTSSTYLNDWIRLTDVARLQFSDLVEDQLSLDDAAFSITRNNSNDSFNLADTITGQRLVTVHVNDQFKLSDTANSVYVEQLTDSILLGDFTTSKLYGKSYAVDSLILGDEDLSSVQLASHAVDSIRLGDATQSLLTARTDSIDYFSLYDQIKDSKEYGQAWTANTDTWAMSRYMPFAFDGLAVINDKLYGWNANGVYLMDKPEHSIHGLIQTGKLDFGETLVHPTAAFLEYEMSGTDKQLNIAVTTTQSGKPSTYTYVLPDEQAEHLTNGRVLFGRGLRGRHFAFGISIAARSAKINALSLDFTKTARRI